MFWESGLSTVSGLILGTTVGKLHPTAGQLTVAIG